MRSYAFALRDIAKALTFEDSCSVALDYMLMADSIIIELQDSIGMASITNGLGNIYYRCGNFREAKKYFFESIIFDIANSAPSFSALSNVYLDDGMLDSARYYLKQAYRPTRNPYTLVGLLYENYLIEKRDGNISYALQYIEQYNNAKDSLYNKDIKVDIIDAEKRHNLSELLKKNKDLYIAKSFYIILLSLSVIIGLTIYLTYQIRDKNRIRKINDQQVDLEQKEIRLKELENEIRSKNSKLEDTRTLQQEFIKLRQDLNSLKNTKFEADIIVKKIKKLCGKVNPDKEQTLTFKDWNRLTALINSIYPNVAVFIKSNPYNLTEKEIEMCYLSFLQLDVKEESILLDINPESVSKRRLRTRQKLNLINLEKSIYEFMLIS